MYFKLVLSKYMILPLRLEKRFIHIYRGYVPTNESCQFKISFTNLTSFFTHSSVYIVSYLKWSGNLKVSYFINYGTDG